MTKSFLGLIIFLRHGRSLSSDDQLAEGQLTQEYAKRAHMSTVALARRMAAAIRAAGGEMRSTEYQGKGHNIADRVYNDAEVIDWLLNQKRRNDD